MVLIDGRKIAAAILDNLQKRVEALPRRPILCDVMVGDDQVSLSYVNVKARTAEKIGMEFRVARYPAGILQDQLVSEIQKLNQEECMCGIIVQLPLPSALNATTVLNTIDPVLDVDYIGGDNAKAFYAGQSSMVPPTAGAIVDILDSLPERFENKIILVVGQGSLVGKPVTQLLKAKGFKVEVADRQTQNLQELTLAADVIISGTGQPALIKGDMIKSGAVVIDAGTAESEGGIVGDVDQDSIMEKAGFLSPVPGGVGPVTVARLLLNAVAVAETKLL